MYGDKGSSGSPSFYYANGALNKIKCSLRKRSSALGTPQTAALAREAASQSRTSQQEAGRGREAPKANLPRERPSLAS